MGEAEKLVAELRAQAKLHADQAAEMWSRYHSTPNRRRAPLPWMCRQEEERGEHLTEAADLIESQAKEIADLRGGLPDGQSEEGPVCERDMCWHTGQCQGLCRSRGSAS